MDLLSSLLKLLNKLNLVIAIWTVLIFCTWKYIIYPAFLSPLSRIPNAHKSSSISPIWILSARLKGRGNRTIHEAHEKLGPIVRLSPTEVSINLVEDGIKIVYGGGFPKHEWYPRVFGSYGTHSMFATTSNSAHSARKRMLTNIYSKSYLNGSPHLSVISESLVYGRLLPKIEQLATSNTTCNVHDLNQAFTMDFVSSYLFGLENGTDFIEDCSLRESVLRAYFSRKPFDVFFQEIPKLTSWATFLKIPLIPKWRDDANKCLDEWGATLCERAEQHLQSSDVRQEPLVYKRLRDAMTKGNEPLMSIPHAKALKREVSCELLDHLTAGFETSAVALTYAIWELSKDLSLQQQLRDELSSLSPKIAYLSSETDSSLPSSKAIDALPLLDAIVMETLRLHAPIPGAQPREVPSDAVLAGKFLIPAGTRISAQAYSLHRSQEVFPDAEAWLPDRWLKPTSADLARMRKWFWAFGSGGRMCVGSNLALQEMKLMLAAVYTQYTSTIIDDEGIEAIDAYTVKPQSNKLMVSFNRI